MASSLIRRLFSLVWIPLVLAGGCSGGTDEGPPPILLITVDSLRADRVGAYGYLDAASPHLDRVAEEGLLVDHAIASAPLARPAMASLLTGLYPPEHGVRTDTGSRLAGEATTLTEHLAAQGYRTAAVIGAAGLGHGSGLQQGFEHFHAPPSDAAARPAEWPAERITDRALEVLAETSGAPWFLWVHYQDPHAEHAAPPPIGTLYQNDPYGGEIAYVDQHVGRLFAALEERGLLDRTLIAVTADHGEGLGDHGEDHAGLFVYDSTLHVPLMLRLPGVVSPGSRATGATSSTDLVPTLLELARLPPLPGISGTSFGAAARGQAPPPRDPVYAESQLPLRAYGWAALAALHDGRWKYIEAPQPELYDLQSDPGELRNLAPQSTESVRAWAARLGELRARWPVGDDGLDAEARARLASLGYAAAGAATGSEVRRPDPKRGYLLHAALERAGNVVSVAEAQDALGLVRRVLEQDADNPTALALAGTLQCTLGDCDAGVELLERAVAVDPSSATLNRRRGDALHAAGRLDEAERAYRVALELHPDSTEARYGLAGVRQAAGDVPGAMQALQEAVDLDPLFADGWHRMGVLAEKGDELERAGDLYRRALDAAPHHRAALFDRAKVLLRIEDIEGASREVETLLASHPRDPAGRFLAAQVALSRGDEAAARTALEAFLSQTNADPRLVPTAREQLAGLRD